MNWYLFNGNIYNEGQMHTIWMKYHMKDFRNFSKWLEKRQKVS